MGMENKLLLYSETSSPQTICITEGNDHNFTAGQQSHLQEPHDVMASEDEEQLEKKGDVIETRAKAVPVLMKPLGEKDA